MIEVREEDSIVQTPLSGARSLSDTKTAFTLCPVRGIEPTGESHKETVYAKGSWGGLSCLSDNGLFNGLCVTEGVQTEHPSNLQHRRGSNRS